MTLHIRRLVQNRYWGMDWSRATADYLLFQMAAYVLLNLGEDIAIAALMFC